MLRKFVPLIAVAIALLAFAPTAARAQVSFGINIGAQPVCPYGYFDYAPYSCAPYGYYGPQWFNRGAFVGAGPWYRGPREFYGPVNRRFDPRYGYRRPLPRRGPERFGGYGRYRHRFHGDELRDGRGHGRDEDHHHRH